MGITRREGAKGTTFQAKVRVQGFPAVSKTFASQKEAEDWYASQMSAIGQGIALGTDAGRNKLFKDVAQRYLEEVVPKKRGSENETYVLNEILESDLAKYTLENLSTAAVRAWRDALLSDIKPTKTSKGRKANSAATVIRKMGILHHIIEHARKEWGWSGGVNPVSDVTLPEAGPGRDRRLDEDEAARLIAGAAKLRNKHMHDVIVLALETGMRQGEVINMRWAQVKFDKKVYALKNGETKNGTGRAVPLSPKALEVLQARRALIDPLKEPRVFPGLTSSAVKQSFSRLTDSLKIEDLRFHDLRHEAASRLSDKGFNLVELTVFTGHKDMRMVKRYAHPDPSKLAARLAA